MGIFRLLTAFVDEKLTFSEYPTIFVLGYTIEVFDVIDQVINHFKKEKNLKMNNFYI